MKTFSCFGAFSYRTQLPVSHGSRSDLSQTLPLYSPVSKTKVSFVKKKKRYYIVSIFIILKENFPSISER